MVPSQCGHKGYRKDCDILKDRRKNWPEREEMHENVEVGEETKREMETKFPRPIIVCFFYSSSLLIISLRFSLMCFS